MHRAVRHGAGEANVMRTRLLGKTSLQVSTLCYGTWQFGGEWGSFDASAAKSVIRRALELGIDFFDTAQAYGFGVSERLLGEALEPELRRRRETITLATKGGLRMHGTNIVRDSSPAWLRQGVEASLRNLGVDVIDLYQVHWPDAETPFGAAAEALAQLVDEGKIRYIGVSNFDVAQMREFEATRRIDTAQPPYHLFRRDVEQDVLRYCRERDIGVLVYSPLAHGLLGGTYTSETTFADDDWRSRSPAFQGEPFRRNLAVVDRLKSVAERQGITVAQLAVAWTLAHPAVHAAIVGAHRHGQLATIVEADDVSLSADVRREIDQVMQDAAPMGGPSPEGL
jgi:aryl-alcohol dehydrogenase-like predicted oxidoreductase